MVSGFMLLRLSIYEFGLSFVLAEIGFIKMNDLQFTLLEELAGVH